MKNVISYSFFDPKVLPTHRSWDSLKSNAERYYFNIPSIVLGNAILFPDSEIKFFITENTLLNELSTIFRVLENYVTVVSVDMEYSLTEPSILRMIPLWENYDNVHTRDADSLITETEYNYMNFFDRSNYSIGTIRTHQNHYGYGCCMLAGMSSFKPKAIPTSIKGESYDLYYSNNHRGYGCDQDLMIKTFTSDHEYCSHFFLDCKAKNQNNPQCFSCASYNNDEISEYSKNVEFIFSKQKQLGYDDWCGLPVDSRGEYTNMLLEIFPDVINRIEKYPRLKDMYIK